MWRVRTLGKVLCLLLVSGSIVSANTHLHFNFAEILFAVRNQDQRFFQFASYELVQNFSLMLRNVAEKEAASPVVYLVGKEGGYRKAVVFSLLGGFANKDPAVRLYCVYFLLHLAPLKSWIESDLARALDSQNQYTETTEDFYTFQDVYGHSKYRSLKEAFMDLFRATESIVLLNPQKDSRMYQNTGVHFEWSERVGVDSYELYVDDVLYYDGQEAWVVLERALHQGRHEWLVVAKDQWGGFISASKGVFFVKELSAPELSVHTQAKDLVFTWNRIEGAQAYKLYMKKDDEQYRLAYTTTRNKVLVSLPIPDGEYSFRLEAFNNFQTASSEVIRLRSNHETIIQD